MSSGRLPRAALVLFALALVVRVAYVLAMQASPGFEDPRMDALYHWQWARAFAAGESFQAGPFFRAPLYPWFLGSQLALFGESFLAPRLVQSVLGALATVLAYGLTRELFGELRARIAGVLVATHWVLVYFDGEFLIPTLIVPLDLAALWVTVRLSNEPTARRAGLAGLLWGLSCIARPNPLVLMPLFLAWLAWRARRSGSAVLGPVLAWCLGLALPILPITLANVAAGDLVLISSQGGVNFWIGNNPESDGSTAIVPGTRSDWWGGHHDAIAQAEAAEGRALRPSEVSRHYFTRAFDWMSAHPAAALELLAWKARLFVTDWELGNNQEVRFFAWRYGGFARFLPPGFGLAGGFGLLLGLALVGVWTSRARCAHAGPLLIFVVGYSATVVAFFVCARFRVPVLPVLAIFAAHALGSGFEALRRRALGRLAVGALVVVLTALGSSRIPTAVETSDANGYLQLGQLAQAAGRGDEALAHYRSAVAADSQNRIALRALGATLAASGRASEALEPLRTAYELAPRDLDSVAVLTDALARAGRTDEAIATARAAAERQPGSAAAQFQYGRLLAALGAEGAARALEGTLALDPEHFDAAFSLGVVERRAGRPEAALAAWERAWQARTRASDPTFVVRTGEQALAVVSELERPADERKWRDRLAELN